MGLIWWVMSHIKNISNPYMAHGLSHIIPIYGPYMSHTIQFGKGGSLLVAGLAWKTVIKFNTVVSVGRYSNTMYATSVFIFLIDFINGIHIQCSSVSTFIRLNVSNRYKSEVRLV